LIGSVPLHAGYFHTRQTSRNQRKPELLAKQNAGGQNPPFFETKAKCQLRPMRQAFVSQQRLDTLPQQQVDKTRKEK